MVGTRGSALALKQVEEVARLLRHIYPDIEVRMEIIETVGDRDRFTPISDVEGTDFFTREIERKLLDGEIDFAVHSAKDLPDELPRGLFIAAVTEPIDQRDALVSRGGLRLMDLPPGTRIGTSSKRRKDFIKSRRPDCETVDLRGNVDERIEMLDKGRFDAILIAAAGLIRLGLAHRITERIPVEELPPATHQGSLAIEIRQDDTELAEIFRTLDCRLNKRD